MRAQRSDARASRRLARPSSIKRPAFVVASLVFALALVMQGTPAGAEDLVNAGEIDARFQSEVPVTIQCTGSEDARATFWLRLAEIFDVGGGALLNDPPPAGWATSDPLNGTPLGCGGLGATVARDLGTAPAPAGCDPSFPCGISPVASNLLAAEGYVAGAQNTPSSRFGCAGGLVACELGGTFVRYGTVMLLNLKGCIGTAFAACDIGDAPNRVVVTAAIAPTDALIDADEEFAGVFLVTGTDGSVNLNDPVDAADPAIARLYCVGDSAVATQSMGPYPSSPLTCEGRSGL
jgi:hypothetical protein